MSESPNNLTNSLIVFVDVRGFTKWAESVDVFSFLAEFIEAFKESIASQFSGKDNKNFVKHLGDGAMIICPISRGENLVERLASTLEKIKTIENSFMQLCNDYKKEKGCKIDLSLGWGITKGEIQKCGEDYISSHINKCARLCDIARPFGIVIDKDDFHELPSPGLDFFPQTRKLKGLYEDVDVWVTKEIARQFLTSSTVLTNHNPILYNDLR